MLHSIKMTYIKPLFIFLCILCTFPVYHDASFLEMEEIIGGFPALQSEFPYHATIVGRYNYSYHRYLLGGAGILSDYLLISATRCFMVKPNTLKKYTFFAVVGVDILTTSDNLKEIDVFYMYHYSHTIFNNDLAVSKLKESLSLQHHPELNALEIPDKEETFHLQTGFVAGFGIRLMNDIRKTASREQVRYTANHALFLTQVDVLIVSNINFSALSTSFSDPICHRGFSSLHEICGKILSNAMYANRGICRGDLGAPLVVQNKLVGIATIHNSNCDDTVYGTIYTRVANFKAFVEALKNNTPLVGTITFNNHPYEARHRSQNIITLEVPEN